PLPESHGLRVGIVAGPHVLVPGGRTEMWAAFYNLGSNFSVEGAQTGSGYESAHAVLTRLGQLDHRFAPGHDAELYPVLRVQDGMFVEDFGPNRNGKAAQAAPVTPYKK